MSLESIDDLFARWKRNPAAAETVALCEALRTGRRPELVEMVGSHAARQSDLPTLLAAGRMYLDVGRLDEAQAVLVAAGRLAPREGEVYRWLGDVLLRRGDAERAEKVLDRALQFGADRAVTQPLLEHARALVPTQQNLGPAAVAAAVTRAAPPAQPLPDLRARLSLTDEDVATQVRREGDVRAAIDAALGSDRDDETKMRAPPPPLAPPPLVSPPKSTPPPPLVAPPATNPIEELVFERPSRSLGFDLQAPKPPEPESAPVARAATAAFGSREAEPVRAPPPPSGRSLLDGPEPPVNPMLMNLARPAPQLGGAPIPEARDVLEALQIAGVYEPEGATFPPVYVWAKPERVRRLFSLVTLITLALGLVGGGTGTYYYVTKRRAREHVEAEQMLAKVDKDLQASDAKLLDGTEKTISRAFELESRSKHAALTWLHERVLVGVLRGGADIAFEDATQRAKAVGIEEKNVAFAYVASFLFQSDTAGAASTIAKWDSAAQSDAWFQLVAGATFERAGDPRAIERYSAAVKLDPELIVAQYLLTRAMAVDGDAHRAADLAKEFRMRYPSRAEGPALVALAWTRDQVRGDEPPEIKEVTERGDDLPVGLRSVPHAARAILALRKGSVDEARPSLQRGLDLADTPGMAAWLGNIALVTGDESLARKAALAAVSFSAVYPPARVLAARVALLGARLDEALKAAEELPPSSPDVAVVTAAVSYEKLDGERMTRAFDAVPDDARKLPFAVPLAQGREVLAGNLGVLTSDKAKDMADDEAPWADLVAMDWALDVGDLDTAKKIGEGWRGDPRAMRALRLARLARYEGRLEDAERLSKVAFETGTVTMRVLAERVLTLVALKRDADALALFKSYPNVGGPLAKWLRAYATASHGKIDDARAMVSQEDPPPSAAPMAARVIAAMAYAAMKDTRHGGDYLKPIVQAGVANPDVAFAAEKLGAAKPARRGK